MDVIRESEQASKRILLANWLSFEWFTSTSPTDADAVLLRWRSAGVRCRCWIYSLFISSSTTT